MNVICGAGLPDAAAQGPIAGKVMSRRVRPLAVARKTTRGGSLNLIAVGKGSASSAMKSSL